jgi:poly(hydroxyalkanoate) depolymerase family esterase
MMNTYAEEQGFFVLYPEQPFSANFNKCWNWFLPADQARDSGEPQIIATLTQKIMNSYSVNSTAVFVGGLSAGAAMTVIMGATYPDLYHGLAVGAGLEYKAATSTLSAFSAMASGGPSPSTQAGVAFSAMGSNYKKAIPTLVIQGTSDYTVNPVNGEQTTLQMVGTNNLIMGSDKISTDPTSTLQGQVPDGRSYSQLLYTDGPSGRVLVQHIEVDGMGHAWSGGSSSGSYTDPSGPNASEIMYKWFLGLSPH